MTWVFVVVRAEDGLHCACKFCTPPPPPPSATSRGTRVASLRFQKQDRLTRPAEFRRVFERRCSVSNPWLIVYGVPNNLDRCRLGLSVSRKVGSAVERNRLRRLYREAFRLSRTEMPMGLDLVLIPRKPGEPRLDELRQALPALVSSLARRLARKEKA